MTTYFIGDELECYSTYSVNVSETTTGAISGFSRGMVTIPYSASEYVEAPLTDSVTGLPTATNDVLWMHIRTNSSNSSAGLTPLTWYDSDGVAKVRELITGSNAGKIQFWNGTAWTDAVTGFDNSFESYTVWDFRFKIGVEGIIELFKEGILVNRFEGDTSGIGNIAKLVLTRRGNSRTWFHQLIIADYSTVNHTIRRRTPSGAGANTAWSGDFSAVDDAPSSTIGTDAITTSTSGAKMTFTGANLAAPAVGHVIKAVAVAEFSRNDGTGQLPQNIRPVLRVSGTDYEGPVNAPIGTGWKGGVAFWENNPATGAAWANIADVNATEFGVVAKD